MSTSRPLKHVAWVLPQYRIGGAELAAGQLVQLMRERGIQTSYVSIDAVPSDLRQDAESLDIVDLSRAQKGIGRFLPRLTRVRRLRAWFEIERPDVAVAFLPLAHATVLWAARRRGIPVVISERIHPQSDRGSNHWRWVVKHAQHQVAGLVVLDASASSWYPQIPANKVRVIPNPVLPALPSEAFDDRQWVVGVGRLERQKRFDLLLTAFANALPSIPSWHLMIWGVGSQRTELERLGRHYGLGDRVRFAGRTSSPRCWVPSATSVFVLSSDFEGFPNALGEAMAAGMPVISTNCPTGPGTMIRGGVDGLLVQPGDAEALRAALVKLGRDAELRSHLGRNAALQSKKWNPQLVADVWKTALEDAISHYTYDRSVL